MMTFIFLGIWHPPLPKPVIPLISVGRVTCFITVFSPGNRGPSPALWSVAEQILAMRGIR